MLSVLVLISVVRLASIPFDPTGKRNAVIFPCGHESDAYWVHIAAAVLAIDSVGEWAVWMTGAQESLRKRPQRSKYDQERLKQLNRGEPELAYELVFHRYHVNRRERPVVVVLYYAWANLGFGLGFQTWEQVPEPTRHVYVTVFEADGPSLAMVLNARRMDEVWTACHNNAVDFQATLRSIGTEGPPVQDVPAAMPLMNYSASWVDPQASRRASTPSFVSGLSVDAAAVFLFMKRASYDSGLDILMRAFMREFPAGHNAPQLILKLTMGPIQLEAMLRHVLESCPDCPRKLPSNVFVITDHLDDEELEALYSISDFSIEPTRTLGCMSVPDMHMMQRGRPHIGPAVNFCKFCRVQGSPNGTSGVFTVKVTDVIPAFSEFWLNRMLFGDFLEHHFVQPDEADLRRQMRTLVFKSSVERRRLGAAAAASMVRLSDRAMVGTALVARLNALSVRNSGAGDAPRLSRPWAAKLWSPGGMFLPSPPALHASWSNFVSGHRDSFAANAAALQMQSERGRIIEPSLSFRANGMSESLARFLVMGCWDAARKIAGRLYFTQRIPEVWLGLAVAWLNLGFLTPAMISVDMAWELLRMPVLRVGQVAHSPPRTMEGWDEELALLTKGLHCAVVRRLPRTVWHYSYVRMWPMNLTECGITLAPTDSDARAKAHFSFMASLLSGQIPLNLVYSEFVGHAAIGVDGARELLINSFALKEDLKRTIALHFSFAFMRDENYQGIEGVDLEIVERFVASREDVLLLESLRPECDVSKLPQPSDNDDWSFKWEGPWTLIEVLQKCHACLIGVCSEGSPCSSSSGHRTGS